MRTAILASLFLIACDQSSDMSTERTSGLMSTWQAPGETLALTPHPYGAFAQSYAYVAPNGAVVVGGMRTVGSTLILDGFPAATFILSNDSLIVALPDRATSYQRANTYCVPTDATQSCR
jgi:hypothetical protein